MKSYVQKLLSATLVFSSLVSSCICVCVSLSLYRLICVPHKQPSHRCFFNTLIVPLHTYILINNSNNSAMSKINSIPFYMRTMFGWPICRLNIFFRCLIGMQNPVLARYIPLLFDSNHCQHERSSEKHWLTVFFFAYYVCLSVQAMTRARTRKQ